MWSKYKHCESALIYRGAACTVWLSWINIHCSLWHLTMWSHWRVKAALRELTSPTASRCTWWALRGRKKKKKKKKKVQLQCALRHSLTAVMRLEALKQALPRSRLPGNCCYATVESSIKVQRVACWGWTAPRCSKYLWGALFILKP